MPKKVNIQARIDDIAKELANGSRRKIIVEKFTKKWKVGKTIVDKYIREAKEQAAEAQVLRQKAEVEAEYELAKETEKMRLLNRIEKRDVLAKIVRGEIEIKTKKPAWNSSESKFVMIPATYKPDYADIMRAIDMDNRMEGDYAPSKVDHTTNGESLNMTDNQFDRLIEAARESIKDHSGK